MKLKINLGVPTEALLKHPTACFNLSKAMTRVSDALSFGAFYLAQSKGDVMTPKELEHMSASIWTSGKSAEDLGKLVDDPDIRKAVEAYRKEAVRLNTAIRSNIPSVKALKAKAKGEKVQVTPVTVTSLVIKTTALRSKLSVIEKKVESLCTVDKPAAPSISAPAMKGRAGMSGSGTTHRKRPMYPRYFVASMGRSRR